MEKRKQGRPHLKPEDRRLPSMAFRPTRDIRERLEKVSAESGKSLSFEIERRLERSFLMDDLKAWLREFGKQEVMAQPPVIYRPANRGYRHNVFARAIATLNLPRSALKRFSEAGIYMIGDLAVLSRKELYRQHHIGPQTINRIEQNLKLLGLSFEMEDACNWQVALWGYEPETEQK